jgi:hypothetical protein
MQTRQAPRKAALPENLMCPLRPFLRARARGATFGFYLILVSRWKLPIYFLLIYRSTAMRVSLLIMEHDVGADSNATMPSVVTEAASTNMVRRLSKLVIASNGWKPFEVCGHATGCTD